MKLDKLEKASELHKDLQILDELISMCDKNFDIMIRLKNITSRSYHSDHLNKEILKLLKKEKEDLLKEVKHL